MHTWPPVATIANPTVGVDIFAHLAIMSASIDAVVMRSRATLMMFKFKRFFFMVKSPAPLWASFFSYENSLQEGGEGGSGPWRGHSHFSVPILQ